MEQEWAVLAISRPYRRRLRTWAAVEPVLDYQDGRHLIATIRGSEAAALEALHRLGVAGDTVATRTALQILLPRLLHLATRPSLDFAGLADMDERLAVLIDVASHHLMTCEPGTTSTPYDFRLWSNIRRTFTRHHRSVVQRAGAEVPLDPVDDDTRPVPAALTSPEPSPELDVQELAEWVARTAEVSMATATLVTVTRLGGIKMSALAEAEGVAANRLIVRRRRAERRLAQALAS